MNWDRVWTVANWERLLVGDLLNTGEAGGLLITLLIGMIAIVASTLIGTFVGLMRNSERRILWVPALLYIQGFRNVPLLILVFWAFFFPPVVGIDISKFASVLLALTLFTGAYIAEIVRGGIRSVTGDQIEAAGRSG